MHGMLRPENAGCGLIREIYGLVAIAADVVVVEPEFGVGFVGWEEDLGDLAGAW